MQALPSAIVSEMNATHKRPVLLYEIGLSSVIRFAAYRSNIVFPTLGNVFSAKAIQLSGLSQSLEGQIGRITIKFDNVARDMGAYAAAEDFKGKSIVIKRIYMDAIGAAENFKEIFRGYLETPSDIGKWLTVSATAGQPLYKKALTFPYQRLCPWNFGDEKCNTDGHADLSTLMASGTADSGTTVSLTDSTLTQVNNYWNFGQITIAHGGASYRRRVKSFDSATATLIFDVELPVSVDSSTVYTVFKGCDKTLDTCEGNNAWGPSADNYLNFNGCIHISAQQDSE